VFSALSLSCSSVLVNDVYSSSTRSEVVLPSPKLYVLLNSFAVPPASKYIGINDLGFLRK